MFHTGGMIGILFALFTLASWGSMTEKCTSENNYLEATLRNIKTRYPHFFRTPLPNCSLSSQRQDFSIQGLIELEERNLETCMALSLRKAPKPAFSSKEKWNGNIHYVHCSSNQGVPEYGLRSSSKPLQPPCLSKDYLDFNSRSFRLAIDCANHPKPLLQSFELFQILNRESHFHLNIVSPTKASGTGQLTPPAIGDVNRQKGDYRFRPATKNLSCEILGEVIEKPIPVSSGVNTCQRTHLPLNPARSYYYAAKYFGILKKRAQVALENSGLWEQLSSSNREEIQSVVAMYMYNGGSGTIASMITNYARTKFKNPKACREMNLTSKIKLLNSDSFSEEFGRYLQKTSTWPETQARREEVSQYHGRIRSDVQNLSVDALSLGMEGVRCY